MMASQGTFPLVLSIPKFSYVTTTAGRTSPLSWTHISGGADLIAVFDRVLSRDEGSTWTRETRTLKVLRGADVLEDLDLDALAREAVTSSSSQMQISNAKAPIAVIVKSPCLAIRYPTRVNQIRRFQLKFASNADYCKAISILSDVGCPITESTVGGGQPSAESQTRPDTSTWSQDASSSVRAGTSHSENYNVRPAPAAVPETRPSTVGSSSTLTTVPPSRINQMANLNRTFQTNLQNASNNERPSTAPILEQDSLSQFLPPKRELPFARPQQRLQRYIPPKPAIATAVTNSRETTEVRPQTHTGDTSVTRSLETSLTRPNLSATNTPVALISAASLARNNSYSGDRGESTSFASSSVSPMKRPLENAPEPSPAKMVKPLTADGYSGSYYEGTEALPSASYNPIQQLPPQMNQLSHNPVPNPPNNLHQPPPQQLHDSTPAHGPAPASGPVPTSAPPPANTILTTTDLSTYLSTPSSERSALIESWVCQQLESDAFLALCQDVESVWKRVAFGM